ncbi:uncharacterized protein LOC128553314 [Mercenaria mercenaria]|uniref:uncharacterized protein LOC128553314 n=1 Tax=Mercenaria mercenaria TaxID=6596 RepID=UPI00234E6BE1|nr:uncharacterized protein LOC128553314 [Mercenaria mercenaria]
MAEGGDLTSVKDGSDADFELVCTPCGEDDIREEAVKFCVECNQYLCTTCARCHRRIAASKSHKLLDREDAKNTSMVAMTAKCRYHPDRDIEMFCGTHDMVYCTKCVATEHRLEFHQPSQKLPLPISLELACENVKSIDDMPTSLIQQNDIQRLQFETKAVHDQLVAAKKKKQKNVASLEVQRSGILHNIQDIENTIGEYIGKLKREAVENLNKTCLEANGKLESEINLMANTITEVDKSKSILQTVNRVDAGQRFVQIKLIERSVKDAKKLFEESQSEGTRIARFTENANLRSILTTVAELGRVETLSENLTQITPRQYKVKAKKGHNVRMQNDSQKCYITDLCLLQDGTVVLADYINTKIKRLDTNFSIKDACILTSSPTAICCTAKDEIAVKLANDTVQFISVGRALSVLRNISIAGGSYLGMEYFAGELWVSNASSVNVYNTSGTLLKSINKNMNGQSIFKSSPQRVVVSGETVIVTDGSDGTVCLGRDGEVRRELRDARLKYCIGVSVSDDGTVFLSGTSSHNIVIFSGEGICQGELLTTEMDLTHVSSLCYVNKRNCLMLARNIYEHDSINILEMHD